MDIRVSSNQVLYFAMLFSNVAVPDLLPHNDMFHFGVVPCSVECRVVCGRDVETFEVLGGGGAELAVAPHELGLRLYLLLGHLAVVKKVE